MRKIEMIKGYSNIKAELLEIADTLKNRGFYDTLGVLPPKGLLLHGVPGVGKSLMACALIEESGLKAYTCRKDQPNGEFVKVINFRPGNRKCTGYRIFG